MTEFYNLKMGFNLNGAPTDAVTTMSKEGMEASTTAPITILDPLPTPLTKVDVKDTEINNPNGYGYIKSLDEVRLKDANDIQAQENLIFTLGAITGVSMIVLSILITSTQNGNQ